MSPEPTQALSDEATLALAHTPQGLRKALEIFFEFDARLARIVSATTEPILGQMRLAWWRDTLGMDRGERPRGDRVLDAIDDHWRGAEASLIALVDGWERMLAEPPLTSEAAAAFAEGRALALAGFGSLHGADLETRAQLSAAGRLWAVADALAHLCDGQERETFLALGRDLPGPQRLRSPFRGLAVLAALSERSLKSGGSALMAGRGAALVALRAGLFGR